MNYSLAATGSTDWLELSNGNEIVALSGTWAGSVVPEIRTPLGNASPVSAPVGTPIEFTANQAWTHDLPAKTVIRFTFTRTSGTAVIEVWRP